MSKRPRQVLILWNQVEEDVYELGRRNGPAELPWAPGQVAADVATLAEEMHALVNGVGACGYQVTCVNALDDVERIIAALRLYRPDAVFNLVEYLHDDESLEVGVAGLYELFDVPYTGSRPQALTLCQRKDHTKLVLAAAGLPTPAHFVVARMDEPIPEPAARGLTYPLMVKPALEDASGGIDAGAVVTTRRALIERVRYVLGEFSQPALVEAYIDGREIHAAILGNDPPEVLPLLELAFATAHDETGADETGAFRPRILSYDAKWDPMSEAFYTISALCPAPALAPALADQLRALALRAYEVTGCRDYARIDMRLDQDEQPYILEVNPNPDLSDGSAFVTCALASGRTYAQILGDIIALAEARTIVDDDPGEPVPSQPPTRKHDHRAQRRADRRQADRPGRAGSAR